MKSTIWYLSQNFHQIMCFQKHGPMKWNIIIQGLPLAYKLVWILEGNWREYLGYFWMLLWRHCLRYRWCKVPCAGCDGGSSFYLCLPACAERHRPGQKQVCKNPNSPTSLLQEKQMCYPAIQNFTIVNFYLKHGPVKNSSYAKGNDYVWSVVFGTSLRGNHIYLY